MPDATARRAHSRVARVALTLLFVVGAPVGLLVARLDSGSTPKAGDSNSTKDTVSRGERRSQGTKLRPPTGPAVSALDAALSKTIEAGNYDMTFSFGNGADPTAAATGSGLANLDPQGLSVNVFPHCVGQVAVRVDGTDAWMIIGGTSDPAGPPSSAGRSWPTYGLISFQDVVGSCFGAELKALATIEMSSPAGMLALSQQAIATASPSGTVTVNGEPATEYDVTLDPAGLLQQPGSTPDENAALSGALQEIGQSPMTATIDVNADGYIVEMEIAVAYQDGFTATHTVVLSNFGSAGTIQFPPVATQPASGGGCGAASCPPGVRTGLKKH
jgi:hypothetical protein